jgi:hypothetical protein
VNEQSNRAITPWVRAPFDRFFDYIEESTNLLLLSVEGISRLKAAFKIRTAMINFRRHVQGPEGPLDPDETQKLLARDERLSKLATSESSNDFPLLHAHTLVGTWAALDALVHDVVIALLLNDAQALKVEALLRLRVPLAEFQALDDAERARLLVSLLEQTEAGRNRLGVEHFERLLRHFNLDGPTEEERRKHLIEARGVRNVITHNGGVVDRRLRDNCPWLRWELNTKVRITHEDYHRYAGAIAQYGLELYDRLARRTGDRLIGE